MGPWHNTGGAYIMLDVTELGIAPIHKLCGFTFNGLNVKCEPVTAQLLFDLIKGDVLFETYGRMGRKHLQAHIYSVRQILDDLGIPLEIVSLYGEGYSLRRKESNYGRAHASSGRLDNVQGDPWRA